MIKEKISMKSHDDASLAILKLLGITKTVNRVEIIMNGTDPILVNISYFENEYLDGIISGIGTITKSHILVEKPIITPLEKREHNALFTRQPIFINPINTPCALINIRAILTVSICCRVKQFCYKK